MSTKQVCVGQPYSVFHQPWSVLHVGPSRGLPWTYPVSFAACFGRGKCIQKLCECFALDPMQNVDSESLPFLGKMQFFACIHVWEARHLPSSITPLPKPPDRATCPTPLHVKKTQLSSNPTIVIKTFISVHSYSPMVVLQNAVQLQ